MCFAMKISKKLIYKDRDPIEAWQWPKRLQNGCLVEDLNVISLHTLQESHFLSYYQS